MTPIPSKLNWSTEKPHFKDVEGKDIFVGLKDERITTGVRLAYIHAVDITYYVWMSENFIRYAIIEDEPELLPYKGKLPELFPVYGMGVYYRLADSCIICTPTSDEPTARKAWNEFVSGRGDK